MHVTFTFIIKTITINHQILSEERFLYIQMKVQCICTAKQFLQVNNIKILPQQGLSKSLSPKKESPPPKKKQQKQNKTTTKNQTLTNRGLHV